MWETIKRLFWWVPFGTVPEIPAQELQQALQSDNPPRILDVRTHIEWSRSRIPAAENVSLPELKRRLERLDLQRDRPLVAICLSAHRSIPAVRLLQYHGFRDVRQLKGGILAWWKAGLPTEP